MTQARHILSLEEGERDGDGELKHWSYVSDSLGPFRTPGALRLISVQDLRCVHSDVAKISLYEWENLSFPTDQNVTTDARDRSQLPLYAAISHVWGMSEEVNKIARDSGRPLDIDIPRGVHRICWQGLQEAANAAHQLQCDYIWLDLICLDQISRADPDEDWRRDDGEKERQIRNMANIYKFSKVVVIMVGGAAAVQPADLPSAWMDRAWTLQEAAMSLGETYIYVQWPYRNRFKVNRDAQAPYEVDFIPVEGENQKALIELLTLLEIPDLSQCNQSPDLNLPADFRVRCLDGLKESAAARNALLTVIKATDERMRHAGVWRSMLLRTSKYPVDIVYSVMGLLGVEVDPYRNDRSVQYLFNDLATKAALKGNPGWFDIGDLGGSLIPRDQESALVPQVPIYEEQNSPYYELSHQRWESDTLVSDGDTYIRRYSIRFMTSSLPHVICARMLQITKRTEPLRTTEKDQYRISLEYKARSKERKGECTYRGHPSTTAVLIGTIGSHSSLVSPHDGSYYILFLMRKQSIWSVCGDGRLAIERKSLPPQVHLTIGRNASNNMSTWVCDCKASSSERVIKLPLSFGLAPLEDVVYPHERRRKPIHWYGIKGSTVTVNEENWQTFDIRTNTDFMDEEDKRTGGATDYTHQQLRLYACDSESPPEFVDEDVSKALIPYAQMDIEFSNTYVGNPSIDVWMEVLNLGLGAMQYMAGIQFRADALYLKEKSSKHVSTESTHVLVIPYKSEPIEFKPPSRSWKTPNTAKDNRKDQKYIENKTSPHKITGVTVDGGGINAPQSRNNEDQRPMRMRDVSVIGNSSMNTTIDRNSWENLGHVRQVAPQGQADARIENWESKEGTLGEEGDRPALTVGARDELDLRRWLPTAAGAAFDPQSPQLTSKLCHLSTCSTILDKATEWADAGNQCIFWLSGLTGTGKTTIASTLARKYIEAGRLGASFFFSGAGRDTSTALRFCTTIAWQLARNNPELRHYVSGAVAENTNITTLALREQWELLVLKPLIKLASDSKQPTPIIVVDALDSCSREWDRRLLTQVLTDVQNVEPLCAKIFVTSGPSDPARHELATKPGINHYSLDVDRKNSSHDGGGVTEFLRARFEEIREKYRDVLSSSWPGDQTIELISHRSCGSFLYADTLCRFITTSDALSPQESIDKILPALNENALLNPKLDSSMLLETELNLLYLHILQCWHTDLENSEGGGYYLGDIKTVMASVVTIFEPLSAAALGRLLNMDPKAIQGILQPLRAFLHIPEDLDSPVHVLHSSFRHFLLSERCSDPRFAIDERTSHAYLAKCCLVRLSLSDTGLKRDVCGLQRPGVLASEVDSYIIAEHLLPESQYSFLHWVRHLQFGREAQNDNNDVHVFLEYHLLHWLEALCLIGRSSEGIMAIILLEKLLDVTNSPRLYALAHDAKRFILSNKAVLEQAPLQIYYSGLLFAPNRSLVKAQFVNDLLMEFLDASNISTEDWGTLLYSIEGGNSATFSNDGRLIATTSYGTVYLWDTETGAVVQKLKGNRKRGIDIAFSPNDETVALGASDGKVWLWNTATGSLLHTLKEHKDGNRARAVVFSPDDAIIASGSEDMTVCLWDARTGMLLQKLKGHQDLVSCLVFSPNGKLLVSGSNDNTATVWDSATGSIVWKLNGHTSWIYDIAFSPVDERILATASSDKTARLWDITTGINIHTLNHSDWVNSVSFSADGRTLASGSRDKTIAIWDVESGSRKNEMKGHSSGIFDAAFSPGGNLVASASIDKTVRVWDPTTGANLQTFKGHKDQARVVSFSPNGKFLLSQSDDGQARVWDMVVGTAPVQQGPITAIALSPNKERAVLVSRHKYVHLWNVATRTIVKRFGTSSKRVIATALSQDSRAFGFVFDDGTVRLKNPTTGDALQKLDNYKGSSIIAFSPDSSIVALEWDRGRVRIVIVATGETLQTFKLMRGSISTVSFSADGKIIASASNTGTIMLANVQTGEEIQTFDGHTRPVNAVAFSADSKTVASASDDRTVRVWSVDTVKSLHTFKDHRGSVCAVDYSPNGKVVASASNDRTIRLWSTEVGTPLQVLPYSVSEIRFSDNGRFLKTNRGLLPIEHGWVDAEADTARSVFLTDDWITLDGGNYIWLPPEFRTSYLAFQDGLFVMGHQSGRVNFLQFKDFGTKRSKRIPHML